MQSDACDVEDGSCWNKWYAYWSVSMFPVATASLSYQNYTYTYTKIESQSAIPWKTVAVSELIQTHPVMDGGFTIGSITETGQGTTYVQTSIEGTTYTTTGTETREAHTQSHKSNMGKPTCSLQSYQQGCQDWWSSHISWEYNSIAATSDIFEMASWYGAPLHTPPPCTQASVTGELCDSFRESYMTVFGSSTPEPNNYVANSAGYVTTGLATSNGTAAFGWGWPSSSTLAPGCTLGWSVPLSKAYHYIMLICF